MKNSIAAILAVALATFAHGADFAVPQGGGKLPTIALVECLADENTQQAGQYCRATYDCDGDTGVLWEGLQAHNGRRVTLESDAISNQRDCVLTVDDAARVQFFTGYRPAGRTGDVVAMVRSGSSAASATTGSPVHVPAANMLGQFLSHAAVRAATLADWCEGRGGDNGNRPCNDGDTTAALAIEAVAATDKTACYIEAVTIVARDYPWNWLPDLHRYWLSQNFGRGDGDALRLNCNDL